MAKNYREGIDETVGFMSNESMQADNSFFAVLANAVTSDRMTWYLATQITKSNESMQADNSFFAVLANAVTSDKMTWYLATQITKSMQLLSKPHQLKVNFNVKFIPVRVICLWKELKLK